MHGAVAKRGKLISRHYLQGKETFRQKFLDYHRQADNLLRDSNGNIDLKSLFVCFYFLFAFYIEAERRGTQSSSQQGFVSASSAGSWRCNRQTSDTR